LKSLSMTSAGSRKDGTVLVSMPPNDGDAS
jgi:hypothetical protein